MIILLHGCDPVGRDAHADDAAADPGADVARLERGLHRPLELRLGVDGRHPAWEGQASAKSHRESIPFPLLALWGNKKWPPSMKGKKLKNYQKVKGAKGCKWSSLKAPGTESPLSHPVLKLEEFPFSIISPLG